MELKPLQLEMPLEAVVLRHSAAASGPLWVCLAVLAAAFGLWRIRSAAVASKLDDPLGRNPDQNQLQKPSPKPQARAQKETSPPVARTSLPHVAVADEHSCLGFTRKATLFEARCYCEEDEGDDGCGGAVEGDDPEQEEEQRRTRWALGGGGGGVYGDCRGVQWGERWRGDLGWYLHQDVAALNGRVVRLWEDERRLAASRLMPRRRRPQVAL